MKTVVHVLGARPNYMKTAPVFEALRSCHGIKQMLVNTGQHYDDSMAGAFFRDLELPPADRDLEIGSASHAVQTARIMMAFEAVCLEVRPDLVVVVGDVNSTMAATLVAAKLQVPVAHVEAGLRSGDRAMPEEINRMVTDRLADLLLTPSADADENLKAEGVAPERIHRVGNVMIDTLLRHLPHATLDRVRDRVPVEAGRYAVVTLHRPSNVDDPERLSAFLLLMSEIGARLPVVFPVHPRTRARLGAAGFNPDGSGLILTEPMGYVDFVSLVAHARVILTDSGGLQEESTALGIPCLTLRDTTERPVTVTDGTNRVVGTDPGRILGAFEDVMRKPPTPRCPELWDGRTAPRIADVVAKFLDGRT
jgi:UDP-N-acetylglucosamine 2-epimerase (non-hydrolysing)